MNLTGRFLPADGRGFHGNIPGTKFLCLVCTGMYLISCFVPEAETKFLFYVPFTFTEPYRLLTAAFLHAGIYHFLFNMLSLLALGRDLEPVLRTRRFLTVYLFSAVGGNLFVFLLAGITTPENTAVVGASGAIFGLFGALLAMHKSVGNPTSGLLALLVINAGLAFLSPGISWEAHLGGFLTGYFLLLLWLPLIKRRMRRR